MGLGFGFGPSMVLVTYAVAILGSGGCKDFGSLFTMSSHCGVAVCRKVLEASNLILTHT